MMKLKRIGAAVGVAAVLAAIPLAALGGESDTGAGIPVAQAAPTTLYPGDPGYDDARQWERDLPSYTPPATATHTVTVTPTTTTKPVPATKNEGGSGFPWWGWVLGTLGVIGGLLWWGTTLDDGSSTRASRDDDDDDDWDDDDEDDAPSLTYPAITPVAAAEPVPYPEPPSVPAQPAPSGGSLMDRLGGK
ncbi:hypothetical protein I3U40_08085 [Mycobacteroides abscessus subsp. abscessus]|uniref:hypothetical protein n=1 Tax=Mycobacteroides abscessus TaxID=36809 RepID=UPI0019CFC9BA|nr:hypothetical protein [Mycobacteroides abscessus]QSM95691.1 hypothetical protein I3U31_08075 [Mycobacteroides abscessus subsp. abscessus]QSN00724.1 hypothetical protein I3U40_08085 [Mycobacteroides abscessus subsp. abscessus]